MKRTIIHIALAALAVLGAVSCEKERDFDRNSPDGEAIRFSSFRRQVFTRADIDLVDYEEGTNYTLLAVKHQEAEADYAWATDWGFSEENLPQSGTETDAHAIHYEPTAFFPRDAELDFYALTYGAQGVAAPALVASLADGVTPTINIKENADRLPDLQHSNEAKKLTSSSGIITLPFEHALSAVNFLVSKQDESKDEDREKQLMDVRITEIKMENVVEEATMNVVTGAWSWTAAHVGERLAFTSETGEAITTTATPIGATDLLVFPNDDGDNTNNAFDASNPYKYFKPSGDGSTNKGEQIIVTIKLEGLKQYVPEQSTEGHPVYTDMEKQLADGTWVHGGKATISFPLRVYSDETGDDKGPLHLLRNHKYTLSIFVMRDNVRIVTVSPQVYEWQDVDVSATLTDGALGQPVVFGGLMWMDRNLGAESADCEHDWWHSCGYFYQYARNIPYIINLDAILDADGKSEKPGLNLPREGLHPIAGDYGQAGLIFHSDGSSPYHGTSYSDSRGFYMIYTLDNEGKRVYSWYGGKDYIYEPDVEARTLTDRTYVALRPGEKGFYGMMNGGSNTSAWAWKPDQSWEPRNQQFWLQPVSSETEIKRGRPENQPVPKGWRMPTRADGYKILPEPAQTNNSWMSYAGYLFQGRISDLDENLSASNKLLTVLEGDNYRFQYVRGRVHINYDETPDANGLTNIGIGVGDGDDAAPCVYGIKHQGTDKAYRILIRRMQSNVDGRYFLRIYQFASDKTELFKTNVDVTGQQNSKALSYNGTKVTKWNLQAFDWDHPAAVLDFPLQGYIDAGGSRPYWNQIGICTIMRLPEYEDQSGHGTNWTFYMRNATSGVAVGASSRRALGDCIRLVRDIEVEDED